MKYFEWFLCLDILQLLFVYFRRYGVVEGRFVFEGGSRCGKGEGVHVCVTDQGDDITRTFQLAAQGKVATRRRPRNMSGTVYEYVLINFMPQSFVI